MDHNLTGYQHGTGIVYTCEKQLSHVFYSFKSSVIQPGKPGILGVVITRQLLDGTNGELFLQGEAGTHLKLLSLETLSVSGKEIGLYRFTAEFTAS